jgi:hypothetical protein
MNFLQKPSNIYVEGSVEDVKVLLEEPVKKTNWEDDFDSIFNFEPEQPIVEEKKIDVIENPIWEYMSQTGFTENKISIIIDEPVAEETPLVFENIVEPVVEEIPPPVVEEIPPPVVEPVVEEPPPIVEDVIEPIVEEQPKPLVEEIHVPVIEPKVIENNGGVSTKFVDGAIKRREEKKPNWGKPEGWNKSKKKPLFQRPDDWGSPPIPEPKIQKSEKSKKTNFFKMLYLGLTDQDMVEVKDQHRYDNFMTHLKIVFICILFVIIVFLLFIKVNIFPESNVENKNDDIVNRSINYIVDKFFKK